MSSHVLASISTVLLPFLEDEDNANSGSHLNYFSQSEMSKLFARIAGYFSNRSLAGVDKVGNRYFAKTEAIDGISKWVSNLNLNLNPLFAFNNYFMIWVFLIHYGFALL